jgi:hypothetical protein
VRRSAVIAAILLSATPAFAGDNDIVVARLHRMVGSSVVPQNADFRSMVSELGVVLAPRLLTPSDTLGFGGFQFTADVGYTAVSPGASWWRVREGSPDPGGLGGENHGPRFMPTIGFFARKGIWLPLPSFEIGAGAVHLLDSGLWTGQLYAKFALHEGYHELPLPSLAARGSVSRLIGASDLDLTVVSIDASISKRVGIGGTWSWSPYGGWSALVIIPRSEVLDPTPQIDPLAMGNSADGDLNFVFSDQDDIIRHRFFAGMKFQYYVFQLTVEANLTLKGSSVDDRAGTTTRCMQQSDTVSCDAKDAAGRQNAFVISAGMDF